ncbi:protein of unknown function [Paraburkholderia dioscoreae]|uniref:Uncharacterized protein n=1 Tax=Paraburkholderia dioscoreae TaxID=2604047 RepID=A0A5Q4ZE34_9BURK|nr:protein of unknown function [Paraburkholderia dioscoreae]
MQVVTDDLPAAPQTGYILAVPVTARCRPVVAPNHNDDLKGRRPPAGRSWRHADDHEPGCFQTR